MVALCLLHSHVGSKLKAPPTDLTPTTPLSPGVAEAPGPTPSALGSNSQSFEPVKAQGLLSPWRCHGDKAFMYDSCSEGRKGPARLRLYLNPSPNEDVSAHCAPSQHRQRRRGGA